MKNIKHYRIYKKYSNSKLTKIKKEHIIAKFTNNNNWNSRNLKKIQRLQWQKNFNLQKCLNITSNIQEIVFYKKNTISKTTKNISYKKKHRQNRKFTKT